MIDTTNTNATETVRTQARQFLGVLFGEVVLNEVVEGGHGCGPVEGAV
jgi:hypothetical protein